MTKITSTKVRVAAFWVGSLLLVQRLSELIRSTFLARWFTRDEMGMVAIVLMLHAGLMVFTEMGHYAAVVQRTDDRLDEAIDTSFVASAIRGVALTALLAAAAVPVASFYREPRLGGLIVALSFVFVINGFENKGMLHFHRRVELKTPKLVDAIANAVDLGVTVVVALVWNTIWCVVIGSLSGRVVDAALTHPFYPRENYA